jgi:molybdopterin converting factor small subunit
MPLVRVASPFCDAFTGGVREFEVEGETVRAAIRALDARYPGLADFLRERAAVAIDGIIHQRGWMQPITAESDIVLLPRIGGG